MRIAVVIPEMGTGGAEAIVAALGRHHVAAGHEVTVFTTGGWRVPGLESDGIAVVSLPLRGRSPLTMVAAVRRLRRSRLSSYDVVHVHNAKAAVAVRAALLGRRSAPPVLVTAHGFLTPDRGRAARLLARTADHVVAVSDETADRLRDAGFPPERLSVVENGVEEPPRRDRAEARERLGLDPDRPVVLCLARMTVQKRQDLLIEAWAGWPDAPLLLLAGDGPTRRGLEEAARQHGIGQRVRFLGDRRDADWLLAAADVLVLPSDMEGLPVSVLEAMSLGLPVVASAVGGVAALGACVELAAQGSGSELRRGLEHVLGDPSHRERLVAEGHALVARRFHPHHMIESYDTLLATVSGSERTPM